MECTFVGKSFCFTGKMRELTRERAEQEARSRGALTQGRVNKNLDYLVVGDIPSSGWAFGNYGRKIEKAEDLHLEGYKKPIIIHESLFMEVLGKCAPSNPGELDAKMVVMNVMLLSLPEKQVDICGLEVVLSEIKDRYECHVNLHSMPAEFFWKFISDDNCPTLTPESVAIKCRIVRQTSLEENTEFYVGEVKEMLACLNAAYFMFNSFERREGTAAYVSLIKELPENLKIGGLH